MGACKSKLLVSTHHFLKPCVVFFAHVHLLILTFKKIMILFKIPHDITRKKRLTDDTIFVFYINYAYPVTLTMPMCIT